MENKYELQTEENGELKIYKILADNYKKEFNTKNVPIKIIFYNAILSQGNKTEDFEYKFLEGGGNSITYLIKDHTKTNLLLVL